jgi:LysR family glycine cleavage system transcriptional activator
MHTLKTFECVARLHSFTAAAEELHLTVSAVSHQIRAIETFYGAKLLRRGAREVTLTQAGEALRDVVVTFLGQLSEVGKALRSAPSHRLSLSAPPSFVSRWLMPRLGRFLGAHPDIDFTLHATSELVDFEDGQVDVAIRYGQGDWPGLESVKLFDETVFPVAAPSYLARTAIQVLDDLDKGLLLRDDFASWDDWTNHSSSQPGPTYGDSSLLLQAAEAGQGIALGRSVLVEDALAAGTLVRIGTLSRKAEGTYFLVWPAKAPRTSAKESFRTWLLAAAQR